MRCIGGLEFKIAKGETTSPHCVMRKQCHAGGNNDWETLPSCSQGERDLLVILSAYYLSGSDNVILDEPGESFHPSHLILDFLERNKDKVVLATTHSVGMISPQWKTNFYHMHPNGPNYTTSLVTHTSSNNREIETVFDLATTDMLMKPAMRRIFTSAGVIFVEGINDERVLNILQEVKLEEGATATQSNVIRWDIFPMNGCHDWLKCWTAAFRLGIPYVIVLDKDIVSSLKKTLMGAPPELSDFKKALDSADPSEVQNISKKFNVWIWNSDLEKTLFCKEVTDKLETHTDIMCELKILPNLPNVVILPVQASCESPPDYALVEEQRTPSSGTDDVDSQTLFRERKILNQTETCKGIVSDLCTLDPLPNPRVQESRESPGQPPPDSALVKEQLLSLKEYVSRLTKAKKVLEEFKQKLTASGCHTIEQISEDLGELTKNLIQLSNTRAGNKNMTTQDKWENVRQKLHKGMWKCVSPETLKKIVMVANEVPNHPFNELWEYLTGDAALPNTTQSGGL